MKNLFTSICLFLAVGSVGVNPVTAQTQDCNQPLGLIKNTEFVYQVTDRGKKDGILSNKVVNQAITPEGAFVTTIKAARISNKKRPESAEEYSVRCVGDTVYLDAKMLLREQALKTMEGKDFEFIQKDLAYPHQMQAGQKLPNAQLTVLSSGENITNVSMAAINRKVEGLQQITTPAGTFDTYRITYQYVIKLSAMGVNLEDVYQVEEFYSTENGIIKLQFTNKKGKKAKGIELISKKNPIQALQN